MDKLNNNLSLVKKLMTLVESLRGKLYLAIIAGSIGHILATAIPVVGAYALAKTYLGEKISISVLMVILISLAIIRSLLRYAEQLANHYVAFKTLQIIRDRVFRAMRKLSPAKLEGRDKGELISMVTADIELLEVFYAHTITPVAIAVIHTIVLSAVLVQYNTLYTVVLLIFHLTMAIVVPIITARRVKNFGKEQREQLSNLNSVILDTFMGIKECIEYGYGESRREEVKSGTTRLNRTSKILSKIFGRNFSLSTLVILLGNLAIILVATFLYKRGYIKGEGVIVPLVIFMSSFGPVSALSSLANNLAITFACGHRVLGLLDEEPLVNEVENGVDVEFKDLLVDNISFSYEDEVLIEDLNLEVRKGEILGISGKSGCGKSTLLKLIMRFYDVNKGQIELNGFGIKNINTKNLRTNESYVTQSTHLFRGSILDNVKIANSSATLEQVQEACQKASIDEFIQSLEDGYYTQVGQVRNVLSTGETQRIAVARAFLHGANLMLLDEPTANIDSLNEGIILKSIFEESKNKAVLIVSHKKSTLRIANNVKEVVRNRKS